MRQVILASHGKLAEGLLNSLRMIIGEELTQDVETYCLFPGENPNDFMNKLKERIATNPQMEFVILCDIKGGSVHTALSQLCVHHNVKVFSGMNMNLAMDILLSLSLIHILLEYTVSYYPGDRYSYTIELQ